MNPILLVVLDLFAKSAGVLLLAWTLQSLWRGASAAQRCLVWLAAFTVVLLMPLTLLLRPVWTVSVPEKKAPVRPVIPMTPVMESGPMEIAEMPPPMEPVKEAWHPPQLSAWQWAGVTWLIGAAALVGRRALGTLQLRKLYNGSRASDESRVQTMLARLARKLGVRRRVDLRISAKISVPLTWGFFKPVLMLPEESHSWSEARVEAALCHELGHIRHWDAPARLFMTLACALQWPHALLWLAAKSWRTAQEQACDDLVLNSGASTEDYAMQLLESARSVQSSGFLHAPALTMALPSTLETRLAAIMDEKRNRMPMRRGAVLAGAGAAMVMLGLCATLQVRAEDKTQTKPEAAAVETKNIPSTSTSVLPAQVEISVRVIQADDAAKLQQLSDLAGGRQAVLMDSIDWYKNIQPALSQRAGVDLMTTPSVTTRSGKKGTIAVGRDVQVEGEKMFLGVSAEFLPVVNGTDVTLQSTLLSRDAGKPITAANPLDAQKIVRTALRERKAAAEMSLHLNDMILLPAAPGAQGQAGDLFFLVSVHPFKNVNLSAMNTSYDPQTRKAKGSGSVKVTVTTDGDPPSIWKGEADEAELDSDRKELVLRGHARVTTGKDRYVGTADNTKMVLQWRDANGGCVVLGGYKMEVAQNTPARISSMEQLDDKVPLKVGDVVNLRIVEDKYGPLKLRVKDDGEMDMPHVGRMKAAGLTSKKAAFALKGELEKQQPEHFKNVTVLLGIEGIGGSRVEPASPVNYFTVFGQVRRQGKYEIPHDKEITLSGALALAGGPTALAKTGKVHVVRKTPQGNKTINVNLEDVTKKGMAEKDLFIRPNDVIIVDQKVDRTAGGNPTVLNTLAAAPVSNAVVLDDTVQIKAGDLLAVRVDGKTWGARVLPSGEVQLGTMKPVPAAGLTCAKLALAMEQEQEKQTSKKVTVLVALQNKGDSLQLAQAAPQPAPAAKTEAAPVVANPYLVQKMNLIIFPHVNFAGATLQEAVDFIRIKSKVLDTTEKEEARKGVNVIIKPDLKQRDVRITLDLKDVPMVEVMRYVTELAGMKFKVEPYAVIVFAADDTAANPGGTAKPAEGAPLQGAAWDKAQSIIIPSVTFNSTTAEEAVELLSTKARDLDPAKKGVQIRLSQGPKAKDARFSLDLKNVPLGQALRYVAGLTHLELIVKGDILLLREPQKKTGDAAPAENNGALNLKGGTLNVNGGTLQLSQAAPPDAAVKTDATPALYYTEKMQRIIFPSIEFQGATLEEALEFLRVKSKDLDKIESDPARKGVNILLKPGRKGGINPARISVSLHEVPMVEAVRYVTELAGMKFKVEPYAVVVYSPEDEAAGRAVLARPVEELAKPKSAVQLKADRIIFPEVKLRGTSVEDTLDFLRVKARELDPEKAGVNLIYKPGADTPKAELTLDLRQVSLSEVLRYVASLASLELKAEGSAFVLQPAEQKKAGESGAPAGKKTSALTAESPMLAQARDMKLPDHKLAGVTVKEAVEYVSSQIRASGAADQIKIACIARPEAQKKNFHLELKGLSVAEALRQVAVLSGLELKVTPLGFILQEGEGAVPADQYLKGYILARKAEDLETAGNNKEARQKFQEAEKVIGGVERENPQWQTEVVKFRLQKIRFALIRLDYEVEKISPTRETVEKMRARTEEMKAATKAAEKEIEAIKEKVDKIKAEKPGEGGNGADASPSGAAALPPG